MEQGAGSRKIVAFDARGAHEREDTLAVEAPLEIRVGGQSVSVTMRTPGHDTELAAGFLFTEGVLTKRDELVSIAMSGAHEGTVEIEVTDTVLPRLRRLVRHVYAASSCGICGKASVDAVRTLHGVDLDDPRLITPDEILALPARLRDAQRIFETTGGLHAAGLFDAAGELVTLREDVGRHNAVDAIVGERFLAGALPLTGHALLVSGRASFELVQKAAAARIPVFLAVGAPSTLAVELADEVGMTLVGFLRDGRFNVYAGDERIASRTSLREP
ncbi:MAG: formate dehydrogenase accessory sulfurtransferase FdhD [Polyangiaceae bacterium]